MGCLDRQGEPPYGHRCERQQVEVAQACTWEDVSNQVEILRQERVLVLCSHLRSPPSVEVDGGVVAERFDKDGGSAGLQDAADSHESFIQFEVVKNRATQDDVEALVRECKILRVHHRELSIQAAPGCPLPGLLDRYRRYVNSSDLGWFHAGEAFYVTTVAAAVIEY